MIGAYEKAANTNLRVWARRLMVKPDYDKATEFLKREFRGSVLRGPCTYLMCVYLKKNKAVPRHAVREAGFIAGELLARAIHRELVSDSLTVTGAVIAAQRHQANLWLQHSNALVGAVVFAIERRTREKSAFGNVMQEKMH